MNRDATQVFQTRPGGAQTNTQTLERRQRRLCLRNPRGRSLAWAWSKRAARSWKCDQRGHYWRQLDSTAAAHQLQVCLPPSLTSLCLSLSCMSFFSPALSIQPPQHLQSTFWTSTAPHTTQRAFKQIQIHTDPAQNLMLSKYFKFNIDLMHYINREVLLYVCTVALRCKAQ